MCVCVGMRWRGWWGGWRAGDLEEGVRCVFVCVCVGVGVSVCM